MLFQVLSGESHCIERGVFNPIFSVRAIELDGRNAVYYCNRAAAHSKLNQQQAAIDDCGVAISIDPAYSKAYGRMGYIRLIVSDNVAYIYRYLLVWPTRV